MMIKESLSYVTFNDFWWTIADKASEIFGKDYKEDDIHGFMTEHFEMPINDKSVIVEYSISDMMEEFGEKTEAEKRIWNEVVLPILRENGFTEYFGIAYCAF